MTDKKVWKNCPKCGGFIPKEWNEHKFNKKENKECGWKEEKLPPGSVVPYPSPPKMIQHKTCLYCAHSHGVTCE